MWHAGDSSADRLEWGFLAWRPLQHEARLTLNLATLQAVVRQTDWREAPPAWGLSQLPPAR